MNQFYAKERSCLWQKNISLDFGKYPSDSIQSQEAELLIAAGLIEAERNRYVLTDRGRRAWREQQGSPQFGNLCYGTWRVNHVGTMAPRHDDLFGDVTEAEFESVVPSPAAWTQLPALREAFPLMALETSRALPHSTTMKHTDKGWSVAAAVVDAVMPSP